MASFTNITFAIAMLSLLSSCIHYTNPLVNRGSLANSIWDTFQPKLRRLVDSFEKICMSQNVEFDRVKVEEELQLCFRPPMNSLMEMIGTRNSGESILLVLVVEKLKSSENSLLSQREIDVLRTQLVEPICIYSTEILNCFSPHYNQIVQKCTTDPEGKAMQYSDQIILATCKENGSKIIDFLESGGIECLDQYLTKGLQCLNNESISFTDTMDILKYRRKPQSLPELCSDLDKIHNCWTQSLHICPKSEPVRITQSILREIQSWTDNECSNSKLSSLISSNGSKFINLGQFQLLQMFILILALIFV